MSDFVSEVFRLKVPLTIVSLLQSTHKVIILEQSGTSDGNFIWGAMTHAYLFLGCFDSANIRGEGNTSKCADFFFEESRHNSLGVITLEHMRHLVSKNVRIIRMRHYLLLIAHHTLAPLVRNK